MKKSTKIILIALMAAILVLSVTACATDITIGVSGNPQTTFVKGNDLDLSAGKLSVVKGGVSSEIALNADGVTVSGYDKNTVGEQTLTISYEGASTVLKVNVVERMVAVGHESHYALGQEFDNKGTLRITKDNGETVSVLLKDEKLQLSGFDSTTAGKKTVNVVYTDGSQTFNGSFDVNVYAVDNVSLNHFSMKKTYNSHDTKVDITGGYLVVTINSGAETKNIPLKEEWVKSVNFDNPALTDANPKMTQTVTIDYLGRSLNYTVNVSLSDVTRIKRTAKALSESNFDWTGSTAPAVNEEQGKMALTALELYNDLFEGDAEFISNEEILTIVRPAAVYGKTAWVASAEQFDALFSVKLNDMSVECEDLEATKTQFAAISALESDSALRKYGDILLNANALKDFGETTLFGEVKYANYLTDICDGETVTNTINKIDLMLKMHDALSVVPESWQVSDLQVPEVSAKIDEAKNFAVALGEISQPYFERYLFNTVSDWRSENDYFEILYRYYFEMYLSDDNEMQQVGVQAIDSLIDLCMPGILETYFLQYISTLLEQSYLQYSLTETLFVPAQNIDTIFFIDSYFKLVEISEQIAASNDEMIKTLYSEYNLADVMLSAKINDYGVFTYFGSAFELKEFEEIWKLYIKVFKDVVNGVDGAEQQIETLLERFISLTPEFQAQFLSSVNAYGWADFMPDDGQDRSTMFAGLVLSYYMDVLPDFIIDGDQNGIVFDLFDALQFYMYRNDQTGEENVTYMGLFMDSMQAAQTKYVALSETDKATFDEHIGFFYDKYSQIFGMYDESGKFVSKVTEEDWAVWEGKIEELETSFSVCSILFMQAIFDYGAYPIFVSAYEVTFNLYNEIMADTTPQAVKDIVLYSKSSVFEDMEASLETFMYQFRLLYINALLEYPLDEETAFVAWDDYINSDLPAYMASLLDFYASVLLDDAELTLDMIKKAMADFRALNGNEKMMFILMDGYGAYIYYNGILTYLSDVFKNSVAAGTLANIMLQFEVLCWINDVPQEDYVAAWEIIAESYNDLSAADKALFNENLGEMYEYYQGIYDEIKGEQTNPDTAE